MCCASARNWRLIVIGSACGWPGSTSPSVTSLPQCQQHIKTAPTPLFEQLECDGRVVSGVEALEHAAKLALANLDRLQEMRALDFNRAVGGAVLVLVLRGRCVWLVHKRRGKLRQGIRLDLPDGDGRGWTQQRLDNVDAELGAAHAQREHGILKRLAAGAGLAVDGEAAVLALQLQRAELHLLPAVHKCQHIQRRCGT